MPLHALVLDHDPDYADILADVLSFVGGGPETWTTTSGEAARQQAAQHEYDLVLVTHESTGQGLLADLRQAQPDAVLLVTSDAMMTARQISAQFEAGADEVVQRPFHPAVLVARLNRLLLVRARLWTGVSAPVGRAVPLPTR